MPKITEVKSGLENTRIGQYQKLNPSFYRALVKISKTLKGKTVIHINASSSASGGVAEILRSQIPMERSLGIDSHWFVINGSLDFFRVTKKIHNLLQGKTGSLSAREKKIYLKTAERLSKSFMKICRDFGGAVLVVHDPQPLAFINCVPKNFYPVRNGISNGIYPVLRLHVDLFSPNKTVLNFLKPCIKKYSAVIVSHRDYCRPLAWLSKSKIKVIPVGIDAFSGKNQPMKLPQARHILEQLNINYNKPIITQISRFDPWKDQIGVIKAYYIAKKEIPDLQLVLSGFFSSDDPESRKIFQEAKRHAYGDHDIHLFANHKKLEEISISVPVFSKALYTASAAIMQKSLREGFGMTITEAMWKGKPVVAGRTSGALLQIANGKNGLIVSSPEEAAEAVVRLLKNKALRLRLGKAARASVKKKFLFDRFLLDNFRIYFSLLKSGAKK